MSAVWYTNWEFIAAAAASISVLASVILIMVSRMLELRTLEQTAKTEFIYAASTVFIVIMAFWLIQFGEKEILIKVAKALYTQTLKIDPTAYVQVQGDTLIDYCKLYLEAPSKCAQSLMRYLYFASIPAEAGASVYYEFWMSEIASGFGFKWIAERITNTTQIVTFYMYVYFLLVHALNFVKHYGLYFFSVGVAARAFPPTRGAGAYLMALSLGLYFVFPLSYILVASSLLPNLHSDCALPTVPPEVSLMECGAGSITTSKLAPMIMESFREDALKVVEFNLTRIVRHLLSAVCVFPIVAMVLVLTFVLNTTNLFGGNIPEIGRGLVRLI